LFFAAAINAQAQQVELSFASPYPPQHPFSQADIAWMQHITEISGGRITFKPFWAGSLVSAEMSMLEIKHGVADIGLITPIYTRGGAHLLRTQAGFYGGIANIADQLTVYDCLAQEFDEFANELAGLKVLAVQGGNFPAVLTRERPIRHLRDFNGLRLRVQAEAVELLKQLNADPVNMPMGEVYSALAKGVIDGVVAPADTIYSLHFSEVAKHFTHIRFSRGAYPARAMSLKKWQQLPVDLQQILAQGKPFWEAQLIEKLQLAEKKGLDFGRDNGIEFYSFPADDQQQFNQRYNQVALTEAEALNEFNIPGKAVYERAQQLIAAGSPVHCAQEP